MHNTVLLELQCRDVYYIVASDARRIKRICGGECRAIRGLSNYMLFEAQRLSKEEVEEGKDKFDG